jgi:DOPA 4,5-dioxygenase
MTDLQRCGRVLIHPNTGDVYKDHTELPAWLGKPWPLDLDIFEGTTHKH